MTASFTLRPATARDARAIRALIYQVGINPLSLHWQRFLLAVDEHDHLIACGQVKPHDDGSRELASLAVKPAWRRQGLARAIIESLQEAHAPPLYLICRSSLGDFYRKFGFQVVETPGMPPYFRRISTLVRLIRWLGLSGEDLLVMIWR